MWKQFGDQAVIDENWESMERYRAHIAAVKNDHAALAYENGNNQYADWLSYERVPEADKVAYWNYLGACYWALDADMMRQMAAATYTVTIGG